MNFPLKTPLFILILLAHQALSAQTTPEPRTLNLDEVVQLGMANSKTLQISSAKAGVAHARKQQALAATVPTLSYSGSYYRLSDNIKPFETPLFSIPIPLNQTLNKLSISEPVFTGFRALNTVRASEFLENAARIDLEKDKKDVQLNLLSAAINLYKLQEAVKVFDRNLQTAQNRLNDTRNLNKQGLALDNDVLRAELSVTQIETARLETQNALTASQYALDVLLGLPENQPLLIDGASVLTDQPVATLEDFLNNSTQRADYQAATQRALASAKQAEISKGAYYPLVSIGANLYSNNPNQRQFPTEVRFITTWDAGVQLNWNLSGLYSNRFNVQESKLNLVQANTQRDQIADAARTDISNNFYSWQTALEKIGLYDKAVAQSTENQRITALRNGQQLSSTTDLLDADALLLQSQINQVSARADARLAYFRLLKSAGKL